MTFAVVGWQWRLAAPPWTSLSGQASSRGPDWACRLVHVCSMWGPGRGQLWSQGSSCQGCGRAGKAERNPARLLKAWAPCINSESRPASTRSKGQGFWSLLVGGAAGSLGEGHALKAWGPTVRSHRWCWHFLLMRLLEGSFPAGWSNTPLDRVTPGAWLQLVSFLRLSQLRPSGFANACFLLLLRVSRKPARFRENVLVWVWIFKVGMSTGCSDPYWKEHWAASCRLTRLWWPPPEDLLLRPKNKMSSLTYVFRCLSPRTVEELRLFLVSLAFAFYSLGTSWEACLALQGPALGKC